MQTNLPYVFSLIAVCVFATAMGWHRPKVRWYLWRVAAIFSTEWALGAYYVIQTENSEPWEFFIFLDSLAWLFILTRPAGKWQAVLAWTFCLQILCHIAFGMPVLRDIVPILGALPNWHWSAEGYYGAITFIAYGQLLLLGAWASGITERIEGGMGLVLHRIRHPVGSSRSQARGSHNGEAR